MHRTVMYHCETIFRLFSQYIAPEATTNWPLIGRLAGAVFLFAIIVVTIIVLFKKRKKKRLLRSETKKDELEMEELSVVTAG